MTLFIGYHIYPQHQQDFFPRATSSISSYFNVREENMKLKETIEKYEVFGIKCRIFIKIKIKIFKKFWRPSILIKI